jgi:hypothetical protein
VATVKTVFLDPRYGCMLRLGEPLFGTSFPRNHPEWLVIWSDQDMPTEVEGGARPMFDSFFSVVMFCLEHDRPLLVRTQEGYGDWDNGGVVTPYATVVHVQVRRAYDTAVSG